MGWSQAALDPPQKWELHCCPLNLDATVQFLAIFARLSLNSSYLFPELQGVCTGSLSRKAVTCREPRLAIYKQNASLIFSYFHRTLFILESYSFLCKQE